jgi:hypothetical protein
MIHYIECLSGISDFEKSKEILIKKGLIVKEYDNLYLIKYDKFKCDMTDNDINKCRGLILEKNTNKLVCVPPPHSQNVQLFNDVPVEKTHYEEFVEGTMINIFKWDGTLYLSTRSCLGGYNTFYSNKTFSTLFGEIIDLSKFDVIDDNMNLTFILQHPENIIVKAYKVPTIKLVYGVSIHENKLEMYDLPILKELLLEKGLSFEIPTKYTINQITDVYEILSKMEHSEQGVILKNLEDGYLRSKIWNDHYKYVRQLKGNSTKKKFMYLELRKNKSVDEYLKYFEDDIELFENYRLELYEMNTKLFNYYQDYHVRNNDNGKHIIQKFLDIPYEYRPLCNGLHELYIKTKQKTDKRKVIHYVNNLPSAQLLFAINYKYRVEK